MPSRVEVGRVGEEKAKVVLEERGFIVTKRKTNDRYDLLAQKDGVEYGVNVKHTTNRGFSIFLSNLSEMMNTKRCVPAFLFISERTSALFILKDTYWNFTNGEPDKGKTPAIRLTITITHDETAETIRRLSQELKLSCADIVGLAIDGRLPQ